LYETLYYSPPLKRDKHRAAQVVEELFAFFMKAPENLPPSYQEKSRQEPLHRTVCVYIAGMTDNYIQEQHRRFCTEPRKPRNLAAELH
jgi:dGTPase